MTIYELTSTWYNKEEQRRVEHSIALYSTMAAAEAHKEKLQSPTTLVRILERTVKD